MFILFFCCNMVLSCRYKKVPQRSSRPKNLTKRPHVILRTLVRRISWRLLFCPARTAVALVASDANQPHASFTNNLHDSALSAGKLAYAQQYPPLTFASSAIIVLFAIAAFCFLLFMLFGGSEATEESHRFLRRFFAIAQNDVFFICRIGKFYLLAGQARLVLLTNRKFYNFTLFKTIRK